MCGPEPVLAAEVTDEIIRRAAPEECLRLYAGDIPEAEVWAQACTYPAARRLVLIRGAQSLENWGFLADAAEVAKAAGHVVLISSDYDVYKPRAKPSDDREFTAGAEAVRALNGQHVRCVLPEGNQSERVAWVRRRLPGATEAQAWEIIVRCGHRLGPAASVCEQATRAGLTAEQAMTCLDDLPSGNVADSLILSDRTGALRASAELDSSEYGAVIGQLSGRLDLMVSLHEAVQQGMGSKDAKAKLGVEPFLYAKFRTAAPGYDPARVRARRALLARIDAAYMAGAREGLPEALCALW